MASLSFSRGFVPGSSMLQVAQQTHRTLAASLAKWEMLITYFKHGLEIRHCIEPENESIAREHRTVLTGAMGVGEILLDRISGAADGLLEELGYPKGFVEANLRWLRETYQLWYGDFDREQADADFKLLTHGPCATAPAAT